MLRQFFRSPVKLATVGLLVLVPAASTAWYFANSETVDLGALHNEAVELISSSELPEEHERARRIATWLEEQGWQHPDFTGGIDYVLGIASFRKAQKEEDAAAEESYQEAVRLLTAAESRSLDDRYRPQWAFAAGISLYRLGRVTLAVPLLEEAVATWQPGFVEAADSLISALLNRRTTDSLERALVLCDQVQNRPELTPAMRDANWLNRAQVLLALGRPEEAREALRQVDDTIARSQALAVIRSMMLIAEGKNLAARELLQPVADASGMDRTWPRQAIWLMGVSAENAGNLDPAITYYEQTITRYEGSEEAIAAGLNLGRLQQQAGRKEQALKAYREALAQVTRPEDYQNRWLSREEFQQAITRAWNSWIQTHDYQDAITLAGLAPPLFPTVQAARLKAEASLGRAEHLLQELEQKPWSERSTRQPELLERWRQAAEASMALAEELRNSPDYGEALWDSVELYRRGHDFETSLAQVNQFIATRPRTLLPLALVRKGQILLDLGRLEESLATLRKVIENHPTANAAFLARYTSGQVLLELDRLDEAEDIWRELLTSGELTPQAVEWQRALFSLGRLMSFRAEIAEQQLRKLEQSADPKKAELQQLQDEIHRRLEAATGMMDEYLQRYADSPETRQTVIEARSLLADSLRKSAGRPLAGLKAAETTNARQELRRQVDLLLRQSLEQYTTLQTTLLRLDENGQLDELGQMLLRDTWFRLAQVWYEVGEYEEAIAAYSSASNRYPEDPQVLMSYVQMANAFDQLHKTAEARSMLEQARVILKQMPDTSFRPISARTNMSREQWLQWLQWASRLHHSARAAADETTAPRIQ